MTTLSSLGWGGGFPLKIHQPNIRVPVFFTLHTLWAFELHLCLMPIDPFTCWFQPVRSVQHGPPSMCTYRRMASQFLGFGTSEGTDWGGFENIDSWRSKTNGSHWLAAVFFLPEPLVFVLTVWRSGCKIGFGGVFILGCVFRVLLFFFLFFPIIFPLLASWLLGFLASCLLGFLASWLLGFLASWLFGFLASWLLGFSASWLLLTSRLLGFLAFWLLGFLASWLLAFSASWLLGFWPSGLLAFRLFAGLCGFWWLFGFSHPLHSQFRGTLLFAGLCGCWRLLAALAFRILQAFLASRIVSITTTLFESSLLRTS